MILLDKRIFTGIFEITSDILKNNFFYDYESLEYFHKVFTSTLANEYCLFEDSIDADFKCRLRHDLKCRRSFTSYFVSFHLHDILVREFHFTDMELDLFENILPKFEGVYDAKFQGNERTNH